MTHIIQVGHSHEVAEEFISLLRSNSPIRHEQPPNGLRPGPESGSLVWENGAPELHRSSVHDVRGGPLCSVP